MFPIIINANDCVKVGFPTEQGVQLADYLIENDLVWQNIIIDLQWMDAGILIMAFFSSFYDKLQKHDSSCADFVGFIEWRTRYLFQKETIEEWVEYLELKK